MLVVTAGNQQNLFLEAPQTGNGTAGRGCDGIVVEPDTVLDPHQLNAMLHAAKVSCHLAYRLVGNQALRGTDRLGVVVAVVNSYQTDLRILHNQGLAAVNTPFVKPNVRLLFPGGELHFSLRFGSTTGSVAVILVDDQLIFRLLEQEDAFLGGNVFLHVHVPVEMLVTAAIIGERVIFISWKEESSTTAK